jgi:ribosomal protein L14E/L6E/L27E
MTLQHEDESEFELAQVALAVVIDRVDDHRVSAGGCVQDVGKRRRCDIEQLDRIEVYRRAPSVSAGP